MAKYVVIHTLEAASTYFKAGMLHWGKDDDERIPQNDARIDVSYPPTQEEVADNVWSILVEED